jgi:hypothetical protein
VALVVDATFKVAGAGTEPGAAGEEGEMDAVAVETAGLGVEAWGETSRSVNRTFVRKPREGQKWTAVVEEVDTHYRKLWGEYKDQTVTQG